MKAAFLNNPGEIDIREVPVPEPSAGEVLIRIRAALTCGTDLKAFMRGHPMIPMPGPFGHEFSGVIEQTGEGVTDFKIGDEVMAVHSAPCLKCSYCGKGLYNLCENIMDKKVLGAFAEYLLLPAHIVKQNMFHKPGSLSFEEAAFLEPLSCVVHGMAGLDIRKGDNVLVIGTGPIGLLHMLLIRQKGANAIITARKSDRLDFAKALGASEAVQIDKLEQGSTGDTGFDFVFECTGQVEVWESAVGYARRGGTVVLFGGAKTGTSVSYDTYRLHYDEITLKGVFHFTPKDVKTAYDLLCEPLNVSELITGKYRLQEIKTVFKRLAKGDGIKYALVP
jgi:L-iditol 2-dehydrogenase